MKSAIFDMLAMVDRCAIGLCGRCCSDGSTVLRGPLQERYCVADRNVALREFLQQRQHALSHQFLFLHVQLRNQQFVPQSAARGCCDELSLPMTPPSASAEPSVPRPILAEAPVKARFGPAATSAVRKQIYSSHNSHVASY
ncbi:hypothetical protein KL915_004119 [Ogataea haglerorum]|nr:hypothetical protein KL915_004119 [Ogataea haglerorum]KAG7742413.1 hypothetical protein KL923_000028 [Ogataea haglerorum]KAG7814943.1 hypothetical protein KL924_000028 [Ogataea haglerorum]